MNRHAILFMLLIILTLYHDVYAFKILAIISMPLRSHYMAFQTLFRELANRGHSVTVMNNFPDENPVSNLKFVDLKSFIFGVNNAPPLVFYEEVDFSYLHIYNFYRHMGASGVRKDCEHLFSSEAAKAHLAAGEKYDVIFVEQFMSDCGLAYAAALYDAPIIGITSHVLLPLAYRRLGIPFDIAADSFYFSKSGPNPSLYQKIEIFIANFYYNTINRWILQRDMCEVFNKYLPNYKLDVERVARERMKMMFAYQHFSLTGARVLPPQVIEIGGVHIGKPIPLSDDVEQFLSSAEHGVIYISFGSILKASTMSRDKLNQFLTVFKRIPQKVLWKWENATLPEGHDNVLTRSWLPQLDILCHPKVLAFVSHGGMLSLSEAAHCGKPVLALPFFGDQFSNAALVQASGLGTTMGFQGLNADNLERGIKELISEEMQQSAKRISRQWHDRPQPVMDSAIYWTEYVARHKMAPPSLPSKHNTWFESLLIDVYIVLIAIILVVFALLYIIFNLIKFISLKFVKVLVCKNKVKIQ